MDVIEFLIGGLRTIVAAVMMILVGLILIGAVIVPNMDAILAVFRDSPNASGYAPSINFFLAIPFLFGVGLMISGFYVCYQYFRRR